MISKGGGYPVKGSLECGPESKAQCFVGGVSHAAGRPDWLTGSMRQLEVSVYSLKIKKDATDADVHTIYKKLFTVVQCWFLLSN